MENLIFPGIAAASMAVGALLAAIAFRLRAAAIIEAAVVQGRAPVEADVATQSERARAAEADLLQARLEVQRLQQTSDGWRRALDTVGEEKTRLAERASRLATLEADHARTQLQMRMTEETMRRLSASEAQKEQHIQSLQERLRAVDADAGGLQARLDSALRMLHDAGERRAALEAQAARVEWLEQQLRESSLRQVRQQQQPAGQAAGAAEPARDSGRLLTELTATRDATERLRQELAATRGVGLANQSTVERLAGQLDELQHWAAAIDAVGAARQPLRAGGRNSRAGVTAGRTGSSRKALRAPGRR